MEARMTYTLFIDDYRCSLDLPARLALSGMVITARSRSDIEDIFALYGRPSFISYDHDMTDMHYAGDYTDGTTGADIAAWITKIHGKIPYQVHSMNPEASDRIRTAIGQALKELTQ
jgi:hypothetical protein